jgi:predicted lipoprotein with Yx(FWY)xxD motif
VSSADTSLGTVLVSGDGFTLYILSKDLKNTPSCYGDCMELWPPLLTDGDPEAGEGIDPSKLGVATRHDGTFQATYFGRPLYRFRGDIAPGDTQGHGSENLWQVLLPSGELLDESGEVTPDDESSSSGDEEYNPDDNY